MAAPGMDYGPGRIKSERLAEVQNERDIYGIVRTHQGPAPALQPADVNVDFDGFATPKKKFDCFK